MSAAAGIDEAAHRRRALTIGTAATVLYLLTACAAGQKAYLLPRGDVVFQQYIDLWLHQAQFDGTFQRVSRPWTG